MLIPSVLYIDIHFVIHGLCDFARTIMKMHAASLKCFIAAYRQANMLIYAFEPFEFGPS